MKEFKLKFFGLKKISLSRFEDQLLVVIYTRTDVKIKKFVSPVIANWRKAAVCASVAMFLAVSTAAVAGIVSFSSSSADVDLTDENDEKLKDSILLSNDTNYSDPDNESTVKIQTYSVKNGDTLSEIARQFGVSADTICGSSGLSSVDVLQVGQVLRIPNKEGIVYKVKKGDTVDRIAKNYRVDVNKIKSDNPGVAKNISAGMEIFIPDAKPQNIISGFMWPVPSRHITSGFGWRRHPLYGGRHFHTGLDIRANYQSVRAAKYGKVTFTGWMGGYGNAVVIAHPGGHKTLYGHLSSVWVKTGQYVKQGQSIARSGNTGNSSGPHLHFELIRNGSQINPYKFLK